MRRWAIRRRGYIGCSDTARKSARVFLRIATMVALEERDPEMPVWGDRTWFSYRSADEHATHLLPYIKPDKSIQIAKSEAQKQGLTNIEFLQGDATNLTSISTSYPLFDISYSHQVLVHLSNPPSVLAGISALIKPGGIISTRDNHTFFTHPSSPANERDWELYRIWSRKRGAHPDAGFRNHVWMHESGIPWTRIEYGSAAWEAPYVDKKNFAKCHKKSFLPTYGVEPEEGDREWLGELEKFWDEWEKDPGSRFVGVDGWVIGFKE
ncbi:hypothetical protein HII31_00931 [Pseudocercospora fuligena]|uniref:Methyltransferase domain-containing protein n=1 Tax=Pseudocercospora fuligena TaxID=685502 RepID=A0A8H6RVV0_9PEZI|nr:hypothetical protein HII31_00931 [Pseudocercospora fuligena]